MTCYISSGVAQGQCDVGTGSIKKIWVVGGSQLGNTGYTYDATDQITGATSATGTVLYGFNLRRGVSSLTQNINKNYENGTLFFEQLLNIVLYKYDATKRDLIYQMALNDDLQVIALDQNDTYYMLGEINGMSLGGTATTGTALADRNGFELTFTGQEPAPSRVIDTDGTLVDVFTEATVVD